ncbi:MAG: IPT/TIG domain-containing protein [Burkholderiaceae bacterium]
MTLRALWGIAGAAVKHGSALVLVGLVAACGGGGGGGGAATATSVAPATVTPLTITTFTPTTGAAGSTITVAGAGFTGLQSATLGSVAAPFTVVSDAQLQLVVPPGAQTGRIELTAPGRSVLSSTDFTVSTVPQLTSLSPASVLPGARVTLNGSNLDRVTQVRVNTVVLPIVTQAPALMTVDVPATATSGTVTLIDAGGTARPQSQQLTVVAPMTLTSFSPTSVVTGQALTLNGTNLDRATAVVFSGGATAPVATRTGTTRFTVTVPDAASSGALQVQGNAGDTVTSGAPLAVVPAIRVDATAVYRVAGAGANVSMTGSGLTEVSAVTVRGVAAAVVSKTATQLVFTVPSGFACGAISLQSASQPAVAGGSVIVGAGCSASLAGIEFGQVLSQATTEPRQRLVPGKETWVRVYVVSDQTGLAAPTVRLTGYRGTAILGTLDMIGPATLPTTAGGAITDAIRYSEAQSFNAQLPAAWVTNGLSVRIEVDPEQRFGLMTTQDATPSVGTPTRIEIVLVPVVSGSFVPSVPTNAAVLDELTRRFPIPRDRIVVTTRASYVLAGVTNGVGDADGTTSSNDWSSALSELRQLRDSENPSNPYRYYFGFIRRSAGGIAGIGYVPGRAALGWDSSTGWMRTMSHELGHNLGRPHAPCGGASGADTSWPPEYAGGILGPQPLVDSVPDPLDVLSPVSQTDIMGYCNGTWFSDYNYRLMQTHLESQPQAALALTQAASASSDMLLIAGSIGLDGVTLRPVKALRGSPERTSGDYTLRLLTRDGRTIEHAFEADLVDHAMPPERHFALAVLNPGPLERIEVRRGDTMVPPAAVLATAQRVRSVGSEPISVDWSESSGQLSVRWNAAGAEFASVTHVLEGQRTVLAMHRRGGSLVADTAGLPAGGTFEFSLSDGLNAQLLTVRR